MSANAVRRLALVVVCVFVSLMAIDTRAAVGRTAGQASLGATGAAQYSLPLWTPPGTNGLQPSLALAYSSSSGNGLLGMGWYIAGLSSITRCNQTPAQDGAWMAAGLLSTDKLCLDGSRLRLVSGASYGAPESTYRTEIDTFRLVIAHSAQGNGPAWFEVKAKDGLIYEYGNSTSSFIEALASGGGQVPSGRIWALSRIRDRNNNYVEFSYTEDTINGGYRPESIRWTGNSDTGAAPQYRVEFVYEGVARPDTIWGYRFGDPAGVDGKQNEKKRLDRIDVCQGTTACTLLVRRYDVAYEPSGGAGSRSRIDYIQEYGLGGTDSFPQTNLDWISGTAGWNASETNLSQTIPSGVTPMIMDISGDGRDDIVWSTSATSGSGFWAYMLANSSGGFDSVATTTISSTGFAQALPIQWDGDDKWDILVPNSGGTWWVLRGTGNAAPSGLALHFNTTVSSTGTFWVADINGDGRGDLLRGFNTAGATGYCEVNVRMRNATGFETTETTVYTCLSRVKLSGTVPFGLPEYLWRSAERHPDFNGDGKEDVVIALVETDPEFGTTNYLDLLSGHNLSLQLFARTQTDISNSNWRFGDLNGDSTTDMVARSTAGSVRFAFSRGETMANWVATNLSISSSTLLADWDSDGLADYVSAAGSPINWKYARSTGDGFAGVVDSTLSASSAPVAATGDFTGDDLHDLIRADGTVKYRAHNGVKPDLLDQVTDGFGVFSNFDYAPLTDGAVYTKTAEEPLGTDTRDYQGGMHVVKRHTFSNGVGGNAYIDFSYSAARIHLLGRGFLGFEKRKRTDSRTGIYTEEKYLQNAADYDWIGVPKRIQVKQSAGGAMIRDTEFFWGRNSYTTDPEPRRFPFVDTQTSKNYEVNVGGINNGAHVSTVTTDIATMDIWGTVWDVTTTTTQMGTGDPLFLNSTQTKRIQHLDVLNDFTAANWCLSRPKQTRLTNTHSLNSGASITRSIDYQWDASKCRVTQEVIEPSSATLKVTTDFLYQTYYGNPERITVTPVGGLSPRVTQNGWGPNGQFLQSVTNPLNQGTAYEWYADRGLLQRITDPNSLQTTFEYDAFGRQTQQTSPDSTAAHTDYKPCVADPDCTGLNNVEYKVESSLKTGSGSIISQSFTVLDDFDRVRHATRFQLEGAKSDVLTEYAAAGWTQRTTQPHFNGATPVWTDYTHDILGRVTQESRSRTNDDDSGAHNVSLVFEGLVQKTTDAAGKLTTQTLSAWGDVLRVTDHDGKAVVYEHDAFGNLKKTTDPAGYQSTMDYNVRGWKVSSGAPDLGNSIFDYFPTGELKTRTDANGTALSFTPYDQYYDLLGRPLKRNDPEGATTWTWGNSDLANNIGQLERVNSPGWQDEYTYDSAGRPLENKTTIDGTTYTFTRGYNATTGILETLQYPATYGTPLKVKYEYETGNKSGLLKKVFDFNAPTVVFWEPTPGMGGTNAFSQYTDETLGGTSGARTVSTYDTVTGALNHIVTTDGITTVQDLDYERNKVGYLSKRVDVRQNLTETFGYDNLHRLTSAAITGGPSEGFTYDANGLGNLLTKTGIGTYEYTTAVAGCTYYPHAQPHAVRKITGASSQEFCYDANGNMTKRNGAPISWYSYNLPQTIQSTAGTYATFYYDANRERYKQVAIAFTAPSTATRTTTYIQGLLEKTRDVASNLDYTSYKHLIMADGRVVGIHYRDSGYSYTYFLNGDHLASLESMAGDDGVPFARFSNDAWGMRRDSDWIGPPSQIDIDNAWSLTNRGFTQHEHLDNLQNLIHMNGRVYDSAIGRFISADPLVSDAYNLQALNRYSYVLNNPLSLTDPTGFLPDRDRPGGGGGYFNFSLCYFDICSALPEPINQDADYYLHPEAFHRFDRAPEFMGFAPASSPDDPLFYLCRSGMVFCLDGQEAIFGSMGDAILWNFAEATGYHWWNREYQTNVCGYACAKAGEPLVRVTRTNGQDVVDAFVVATTVVPAAISARTILAATARGAGSAIERGAVSGSRRLQLSNIDDVVVRNAPADIGGRTYTGHALDQMQNRGLTPTVVENTISIGVKRAGNTAAEVRYYDSVNNVSVVLDRASGRVVTVRSGD